MEEKYLSPGCNNKALAGVEGGWLGHRLRPSSRPTEGGWGPGAGLLGFLSRA